jgi:hypothetical protein
MSTKSRNKVGLSFRSGSAEPVVAAVVRRVAPVLSPPAVGRAADELLVRFLCAVLFDFPYDRT